MTNSIAKSEKFITASLKRFALLSLTLILTEACLHILTSYLPSLDRYTTYHVKDINYEWKERFIARRSRTSKNTLPMNRKEYEVHPQMGWVPKKNVRIIDKHGYTYTTNSMGFRSLREYSRSQQEYVVLIVGNSFTYGSYADDSAVWPTILQTLDDNLQVLNFSVAGYGCDQMYLMLKRQISQFNPDLVIVAFISDDLPRSSLSFRGYKKPRLKIKNGELVVTNIPIQEIEYVAREVRKELSRNSILSKIKLYNLVMNVFGRLSKTRDKHFDSELNEKIFLEMIELAKSHGSDFLMLYLPHGPELFDPKYKRIGEEFFDKFVREHKTESLNPRSLFLQTKIEDDKAHYSKATAAVVANAVYDRIRKLSSYRMGMERIHGPSTVEDEEGAVLPVHPPGRP